LALDIAFSFYIFEKRTKNLSIPIIVYILFFVDNSLFVSQKKSYEKSNVILFYSYSIILFFFSQFGLMIEHNKSEIFYFSKLTKNTNLPLLDFRFAEDAILRPKYKKTTNSIKNIYVQTPLINSALRLSQTNTGSKL